MSVRRREWGPAHDRRTAWVVDYADEGKRRLKTFERKHDADSFAAEMAVDKANPPRACCSRRC